MLLSPAACSISPLSFFLSLPRSPRSPLFPYTTLFRSRTAGSVRRTGIAHDQRCCASRCSTGKARGDAGRRTPRALPVEQRSEEHTSELQSRFDLVCRLLLEKKKKRQQLPDPLATLSCT